VRRLAAILVADVVGFTEKVDRDEAGTLARIRRYWRDVTARLIRHHQGTIFKNTGDGFLAEFSSVVEALRFAIAVQERTHTRNHKLPDSDRILLRIGVHHDDVVAESGDLFGNGVNIASRVCPHARPGGVCITQSVLDATRGRVTVETEDLGSPELKGIRTPIRLYGVRFKFDVPEPELPALPQDPLGPRIVERDGMLDLDPAVDPTDVTATRDPVIRQLHAGVAAKAHAFSAQAQRLDNQPGWAGIATAAREFADGMDCPTEALPERLGTIYSALMSLASFLDLDQRLRQTDGHDIDPMAPDIRRMFDDLIRTSAPMLRRFPTIDALDDATSGFLTNPALFAPASSIVDAAKSGSVASPRLTAELSAMLASGQRGGDVGDKAGTRGVRGVRNMLYRGGGLFARFLLGTTASGFANESPLMKRFGSFLASAETDITQFLSDRSADIRHAFARMIATYRHDDASSQRDPTPPTVIGQLAATDPIETLNATASSFPSPGFSQQEPDRKTSAGPAVNVDFDLSQVVTVSTGSNAEQHPTWTLLRSTQLLPEILTLDVQPPTPGSQPGSWRFPVVMHGRVMTLTQGDKKVRLALQRARFQITSQDFRPANFTPAALPPGWSPISYEIDVITTSPARTAGDLTFSDSGELLYVTSNDRSEPHDPGKIRNISIKAVSRISDIVVWNHISSSAGQSVASEHRNRRAVIDIILAQALPQSVGGSVYFGEYDFRYGPSDATSVRDVKTDISYVLPTSAVDRLFSVLEEESLDFSELVRAGGLDSALDLRSANLRNIDLRGQDLSGFDWTGADLSSADFGGATGIDYDSLSTAKLVGVRNLAPPPGFSQDEAKRLILGGSAPPAAWQPFITELQFTQKDSLSDLTPLAKLSALQRLSLDGTQVSNIQPLIGLTALRSLDLDNTQVDDLTPLSELEALQELYLHRTRVSDLTPLTKLSALQYLGLDGTQVSDLTPLSGLTNLRRLILYGTWVTDLSPVQGIDGLEIIGP